MNFTEPLSAATTLRALTQTAFVYDDYKAQMAYAAKTAYDILYPNPTETWLAFYVDEPFVLYGTPACAIVVTDAGDICRYPLRPGTPALYGGWRRVAGDANLVTLEVYPFIPIRITLEGIEATVYVDPVASMWTLEDYEAEWLPVVAPDPSNPQFANASDFYKAICTAIAQVM